MNVSQKSPNKVKFYFVLNILNLLYEQISEWTGFLRLIWSYVQKRSTQLGEFVGSELLTGAGPLYSDSFVREDQTGKVYTHLHLKENIPIYASLLHYVRSKKTG